MQWLVHHEERSCCLFFIIVYTQRSNHFGSMPHHQTSTAQTNLLFSNGKSGKSNAELWLNDALACRVQMLGIEKTTSVSWMTARPPEVN